MFRFDGQQVSQSRNDQIASLPGRYKGTESNNRNTLVIWCGVYRNNEREMREDDTAVGMRHFAYHPAHN